MNKFICLALAAASISGCGEMAYKRGATPKDLELARKSCQSSGDEKAIDQCLRDNGWALQKFDDMDLFAVTSPTPESSSPTSRQSTKVTEKSLDADQANAGKPGASVN
ncbi:MAG: hypothetical protein K2X42_11115, partial [Burkholderiaceae bacterium]|nr:hypothetical protein [Burkholderiaceae bacterium]